MAHLEICPEDLDTFDPLIRQWVEDGLFRRRFGKLAFLAETQMKSNRLAHTEKLLKWTDAHHSFCLSCTVAEIPDLLYPDRVVKIMSKEGILCSKTVREIIFSIVSPGGSDPLFQNLVGRGFGQPFDIVYPSDFRYMAKAEKFLEHPLAYLLFVYKKKIPKSERSNLYKAFDAAARHDIKTCQWDSKERRVITKRQRIQVQFEHALNAAHWLKNLTVDGASDNEEDKSENDDRPSQQVSDSDPGDFPFGGNLTCDTRPQNEKDNDSLIDDNTVPDDQSAPTDEEASVESASSVETNASISLVSKRKGNASDDLEATSGEDVTHDGMMSVGGSIGGDESLAAGSKRSRDSDATPPNGRNATRLKTHETDLLSVSLPDQADASSLGSIGGDESVIDVSVTDGNIVDATPTADDSSRISDDEGITASSLGTTLTDNTRRSATSNSQSSGSTVNRSKNAPSSPPATRSKKKTLRISKML